MDDLTYLVHICISPTWRLVTWMLSILSRKVANLKMRIRFKACVLLTVTSRKHFTCLRNCFLKVKAQLHANYLFLKVFQTHLGVKCTKMLRSFAAKLTMLIQNEFGGSNECSVISPGTFGSPILYTVTLIVYKPWIRRRSFYDFLCLILLSVLYVLGHFV
jgi:hypothetical protein